jgi:glycosyltransferase involved in cell wall biosynthesis
MPETLAIVIPTRDRAHMVGDAINSLMEQTRRPDEIIVVDDGSVDDSRSVLAGFGTAIRVLQSGGVGPAGARNVGLAESASQLIGFLDSDDLLLPDALAVLTEAINWNAADCAWGLSQMEILPGGSAANPDWPTEPHHLASICAMLFRRRSLVDLGGFDGNLRFGEDSDLMMRAGAAGWGIEKIAQLVTRYRRHAGNMTQNSQAASRAWFDVARNAMARRRQGEQERDRS